MANFPVFQGGQLTRGVGIKQQKQAHRDELAAQEKAAQQQALERMFKSLSDLEQTSLETFNKAVDVASQAAQAGAGEDSDAIKQMRVAGVAALGRYAMQVQQTKKMMVEGGAPPEIVEQLLPQDSIIGFVQSNLPRFDAAVETGRLSAQEQQVETLSPEEATDLGFPEGSIVQKKPDGTLSLAFEPSSDMSSLQEKAQALIKTGVDPQRALGIAAGRYQVSVNPVTDERFILDLATGERVGGPVPPPEPGVEGVPSMIPESIETAEALGAPGALKNIANILKDSVGAGAAYPKAQEATEALSSVQAYTSITLQAEVPGRPSNFLMEKLDTLTVSPNSLFQGEERAKTRLQQTKRLIDGEIARIEQDVLPLELPPETRVETQLNRTQLKRLSEAYGDLLEPFETIEAPEGIPPEAKEVWEFMTPEQRREFLPEDDDAGTD